MCGIVGGLLPERLCRSATERLRHRGPDAFGVWSDGRVSLGHARLAILDLDPRSDQPFRRGPITLAYNGEMWNHRALRAEVGGSFQTTGDTEVVAAALGAWGVDALPRFEGMFALAWHDARDGSFHAARDRFGEVPLYRATGDHSVVASERKALSGITSRGHVDLVGPGHLWSIPRSGSPTYRRWYAPSITPTPLGRAEAAPRLRGCLEAAVRERLIADVPVCTLLSGGIDSTVIAYELARHVPDLVAYTAVYADPSPDLRAAREVARYLGVELREVLVPLPTPADLAGVVGAIELSSKAQVEIGWPCLHLAAAMRRDSYKVTFSGEGSDELWASYGFCHHALAAGADWHAYRRDLFLAQARRNFVRANTVFLAHGVEPRLPFLHTPLVELALSLPRDAVRDGPSRPKAVLQDAYAGVLPDRLLRRPKLAFQDGMRIKGAIASVVSNPRRFYGAEYVRRYG